MFTLILINIIIIIIILSAYQHHIVISLLPCYDDLTAHFQKVLNEVETAQDQVNEAVRVTLEKSLGHLEKLRRSSLGFLDAAVTSVSSSAVASAQSTADQLKKELRKVAKSLEERMMQVGSVG